MKMQETVLVACFVLAFFQMGDALQCYQNTNANSTKTLSDCPQGVTNMRCLGGKMTASMTAMGTVQKTTREFFMCTLDGMCASFCKTQEDQMKKNVPDIKIDSCKSYCCTGDGCNKAAEQSTNDGYFFVANAKLVGVIVMFSCVLFSYI
ncbi:uncharacterized protein LOC130646291 [Hydractinia symbiolongicarpus]|uniref:uncharacterized protein LOC130646291 n=1 Tax=Hydractinia symbiolongicarpus TaxID=13093 RepID=UPI00254FA768|nr:uncharacterized protein LOC130646291 [Hydractinia symbiolongicarpus]